MIELAPNIPTSRTVSEHMSLGHTQSDFNGEKNWWQFHSNANAKLIAMNGGACSFRPCQLAFND